MTQTPSKIGPYTVEGELGRGGMGVVYKAQDPKLGRSVAIKALPVLSEEDPENTARLQQEARVLASLNHPNVAAIYGLEEIEGKHHLVLEYVPGESLQERLERGPMGVEETLRICSQIAEGLETAHEAGIIHRDLKPGNVKVTEEGKVKVLDFGLAKLTKGATSFFAADPSAATISGAHTEAGVILGTLSYMSPEQARGKSVDKRTDIWSFGCVMYECLTGEVPFLAETSSDTIVSILEQEPIWEELPANTPPEIRYLLQRCLEKEPKKRLRDMGDAHIELEEAIAARSWLHPVALGDGWRPYSPTSSGRRETLYWAAPLVLFLVAFLGWLWNRPVPFQATGAPMHLEMSVSGDTQLVSWAGRVVAVAPEGTRVVYVARRGQQTQLFLRSLDHPKATPIPDTQGASDPFFSPDGRWV
ncbi:MAG: serine/threonine-protein kinase, partial [Planctomycetota bacterium]